MYIQLSAARAALNLVSRSLKSTLPKTLPKIALVLVVPRLETERFEIKGSAVGSCEAMREQRMLVCTAGDGSLSYAPAMNPA